MAGMCKLGSCSATRDVPFKSKAGASSGEKQRVKPYTRHKHR